MSRLPITLLMAGTMLKGLSWLLTTSGRKAVKSRKLLRSTRVISGMGTPFLRASSCNVWAV